MAAKIKSGIYRIELGNANYYIGSAVNLIKRERQHHRELKCGKHRNSRMQRCWDKHGVFEFVVLEECATDALIIREQFYLDHHAGNSKMANICPTAGSSLGVVHSVETREKMSVSRKGKVQSAETREKISKWERTPEYRARMSVSNKGKVHSAETREKISASRIGKIHSEETRKKMSVSQSLRQSKISFLQIEAGN